MNQYHSSTQQLEEVETQFEQLEVEAHPSSLMTSLNIEDLPPEVLMKILETVDIESLFACRLVTRGWNKISRELLHSRQGPTIGFNFGRNGKILQKSNRRKEESLKDFVQTFKASKSLCPYNGFSFSNSFSRASNTIFDHEDFIQFLQEFGSSESEFESKTKSGIKRLILNFEEFDCMKTAEIVMEKVKDLLLCKIPQLEEFGLFMTGENAAYCSIPLFPVSNQPEPQPQVQLAHLKVLHLSSEMCEDYPGIVVSLLRAGVNLERIQIPKWDVEFFPNNFEFFYSLRKLHLIQEAEIEMTFAFLLNFEPVQLEMSEMAKNPQVQRKSSAVLNLKELKLCGNLLFRDDKDWLFDYFDEDIVPGPGPGPNPKIWTFATNFLSILFQTSKDSLRKLSLDPLGFLGGVEFPVFSNLTQLNLLQAPENDDNNLASQLFPRGVRSRDIFPAVRILTFGTAEDFSDPEKPFQDWVGAFPQEDSIPQLPLVEELKVIEVGITGNVIATLALMCPNLKNFTIALNTQGYEQQNQVNFLEVGRAIWTHMPQLETLEIHVQVDQRGPTSTQVDSCFTGISEQDVQRLCELKKELTSSALKSGLKAPESGAEIIPQRKFPSILNMKNLKKMTLKPFSIGLNVKDFFAEKMSWMSEEYAFKLMPHLRPVDLE